LLGKRYMPKDFGCDFHGNSGSIFAIMVHYPAHHAKLDE